MTMTDPGMEVIPAEPATNMVLAGHTPDEILSNAANIARPLKDLIEKQKLYAVMGRDKRTGEERRHVEVSGWQAAGAMLGALGGTPLHAETIWSRPMDRDSDTIAYEAHVEVRTLAGEVVGAAEAMCSDEESNWRGRDENAIRSMAETRAESRAYRRAIGWIISLAGFSPTPAEEMSSAQPAEAKLPDWAAPMTDIPGVAHNLDRVLKAAGIPESSPHAEGRSHMVSAIGNEIFDLCDKTFPFALARLAHLLANAADKPVEETGKPPSATEEAAVDGTADEDNTTKEA